MEYPQESILSPTLWYFVFFLTCTNNPPASGQSIYNLTLKSQQHINTISKWCQLHGMKVNTYESQFVIIKAGTTQINLTLDNTPIAQANNFLFKFTMKRTLTWTGYLDKLIFNVVKKLSPTSCHFTITSSTAIFLWHRNLLLFNTSKPVKIAA